MKRVIVEKNYQNRFNAVSMEIKTDREGTTLNLTEDAAELVLSFLGKDVEVITQENCNHTELNIYPHERFDWLVVKCKTCKTCFEISQQILLASANVMTPKKSA